MQLHPNCGVCRYCSTGRQNLCDMGATILEGGMPDGTYRFDDLTGPTGCAVLAVRCWLSGAGCPVLAVRCRLSWGVAAIR